MSTATVEPVTTPAGRVRRLPARPLEPPYDDEVPGRAGDPVGDAMQGTLALAFTLPSGLPATPPPLRLVPTPDDPDDGSFDRQPTPRTSLPDPGGWAGRLVQATLEVIGGDRPSAQLLRWTSAAVYAEVEAAASHLAGNDAARRRRTVRPVVRSVHVSEPADGVAEVCALVRTGVRARAVALRLEGIDGRWQCTALKVV